MIKDKAKFYKTVETFSELLERPIFLRFVTVERQARIIHDTIFIPETSVPPMIVDELDAYTVLEHCLAHFAYETNTELAEIRADEFSRKWNDRDTARGLYLFIWQLLEDERVESLWCLIYRGSEKRFKNLKYRSVLRTVIPPLDAVIAARAEIPYNGDFADVYERAVESMKRVRETYVDVPLVEAWKLSEFLLENYDIKLLLEVKPDIMISDVRDLPPEDMSEEQRKQSRKRALKRVSWLRSRIARPRPGRGPYYRIIDVPEDEFLGRYGTILRTKPKESGYIPPQLYTVARRIATKLRFVREKYAGELDVEGDTLDLQAYVNWRSTDMRDEPEIFETPTKRRRACMIILFDMSSSMTSRGAYEIAKRVSTVLSLAASMVKGVSVRVMEFGSNSSGETKIVVASRPSEVAGMRADPSYYMTPIHIALMAARKEIYAMSGAKMVVLVSDGEPCYSVAGKEVPYKKLRSWVAEERRKMISSGIELFSVFTRTNLLEKELCKMYGSLGRWVVVDNSEEISRVLVRRFVEKVARIFRKT